MFDDLFELIFFDFFFNVNSREEIFEIEFDLFTKHFIDQSGIEHKLVQCAAYKLEEHLENLN